MNTLITVNQINWVMAIALGSIPILLLVLILYVRHKKIVHRNKTYKIISLLDEALKENQNIPSVKAELNNLILHQRVKKKDALIIILKELETLGLVVQDMCQNTGPNISMFIIENKDEEYYCQIFWEEYRCILQIT